MAVEDIKTEFEAKYNDQEERLKGDISVLNEQVESKESEIERLKGTIDEYKVSVEELSRALTAVSAGNNDGQYLAATIQEYDRLRRDKEAQTHEFENVRRNLVADLSNRCEKVSYNRLRSDMIGS
jgi:kinesin family protein 5